MATATKSPTSDEAVSGTWTGAAGSRWQSVDDYPDATGADLLTHGTTTAGNLTFGFSAFSIPAGAVITSVKVNYYDKKNASQASAIAGRLKVGTSYFNATTHNPTNGVWTQRTDTWLTNPATSTAWTADQINGAAVSNNLAAFGFFSNDASPAIDLSSIQLQVDYTVTYILTVTAGSYSTTGNNQVIKVDRKLTAITGAYQTTGNNQQIKADRKLLISTGSYQATGNNVNFTKGYVWSINAGTYGTTGNDTVLRTTRTLIASVGSYTTTGSNSTVNATRKLTIQPGGYTTTGNSTGLSITGGSYTWNILPGSYATNGNSTQLTISRTLTIESGGYLLTGNDVNLLALRYLFTVPGSYQQTGNNVQLTYSTGSIVYGPVYLSSPIHSIFNCESPISIAYFEGPINNIVYLKSPIYDS